MTKILFLLSFITFCSHAEIYRWIDDKGRAHYSDQKPTNTTQFSTKAFTPSLASTLEVNLALHGVDLSASDENQIRLAVVKIHQLYRDVLSLDLGNIPAVNIRLFSSKRDFQIYYRRHSNGTPPENVAGFHSPLLNEIVLFFNRDMKTTLQVVTHEASHLLLSHNYLRIPTWLNEGLAEYVELLKPQGQSIEIPPNQYADYNIKTLHRSGQLLPLSTYLSHDYQSWYKANKDGSYYQQAWSIVFYMMSTADGKRTITQIFNYLKKQPYDGNINLALFNEFYPGGLDNFEKRWKNWIPQKRLSKTY